MALPQSIARLLEDPIGVATKGIFGNYLGSALGAAASYGIYSGAAQFVNRYTEGHFDQRVQPIAGVVSAALRWKAFQAGTRQITRGVGEIGLGFLKRSPEMAGGHEAPGWLGYAGTLGRLAPGRDWDRFVGKLGPIRGPITAAKYAFKGAESAKYKGGFYPATAGMDFFNVYRGGGWAAGPSGLAMKRGFIGETSHAWGNFFARMSDMRHPIATPLTVGALLGGTSTALNMLGGNIPSDPNQTPTPGSYWTTISGGLGAAFGGDLRVNPLAQYPTGFPFAPFYGAEYPLHPQSFGGGVQFGQGQSAVSSPTVRDGQMAVAQRMVRVRRM